MGRTIDDGSDGDWITGVALRDVALADGVLRLWYDGAYAAGVEAAEQRPPQDLATAARLLDEAFAWAMAGVEAGDSRFAARVCQDIHTMQGHVREADAVAREAARTAVERALERLRTIGSVEQLMRHAPAELCGCGFDRVMISQLEGRGLVPRVVHVSDDPAAARALQAVTRGRRFDLDEWAPEIEMLDCPDAILVVDATGGAASELATTSAARSYVASPIMPQGTVIGFLHADCLPSQRTLEEFDRRLVATFARGLDAAAERLMMLERLRQLRQDVRRGHASALAVMDHLTAATVDMNEPDPADIAVVNSAGAMIVSGDARADELLTPRQLDVIRLMADGNTNAQIARLLVVSEGTVKSHVKHILRKLRVRNRAEAVSRFALLTSR